MTAGAIDSLHRAVDRSDVPEELVVRFDAEGFARLPALLDPEALHPFAPVVAEVARSSAKAAVPLANRSTYGRAFLQEGNLWQRVGAIRPLTFSERLASAAARLMGVDGVRLYHDQALVKEPGGGHTPWHCDQHYWPIEGDRTVTAWIPLVDVPVSQGPLRFAVGSHRIDLGRSTAIGDESDAVVVRHPRWRTLPLDEQPVEVGDVTFHQGWTFHGAGPNLGRSARLVHTVIYVADGSRVAEPRTDGQRFDHQLWLPDSPVGAPVGSWLNPLVWSSDGSHHPTIDELPAPEPRIGTFALTPEPTDTVHDDRAEEPTR